MTDHLASKADLGHLASKEDLERAINKTILAVFGMNIGLLGLLVAVVKLWPEAAA